MKIPFYRASLKILPSLWLLFRTMSRGWLTSGPLVKKLEHRIGEYLGTKQIFAVSSATAALRIVYSLLPSKEGSEIILPVNTFIATFETVLQAGHKPVLVDIDPHSWNASAEEIRKKVSSKTAAIVFVPFAGYADNLEEIAEIARTARVPLILDSAHALESRWNGRFLHEYADFACYSMYATKNLTSAEGGLLYVKDPFLFEEARLASLHGMSRAAWNRYHGGTWKYDIVRQGFKSNLSDIHAAVALPQIPFLEKNLGRREKLIERYKKRLQGLPVTFQGSREGAVSAHHLFVVLFRSEADRLAVEHSLAENSIPYSKHFIPLHHFSYVRSALGVLHGFPVAEDYFRRSLTLPLYPGLKYVQIDYIVSKVARALSPDSP